MPASLRPREKALRLGIEALKDEEVIAILLGSGVKNHSVLEIAKTLLETHNGLYNLSKVTSPSLLKTKGLSVNKALILIAAFSLVKRVEAQSALFKGEINESKDVLNLFKSNLSLDAKESLYLLTLNRKREIIKQERLYVGTSRGFEIELNEIIKSVLVNNGSFFILVHNHPSGEVTPSNADILTTNAVNNLAKRFSLHLLDHIIISNHKYFSFRENNLINDSLPT